MIAVMGQETAVMGQTVPDQFTSCDVVQFLLQLGYPQYAQYHWHLLG